MWTSLVCLLRPSQWIPCAYPQPWMIDSLVLLRPANRLVLANRAAVNSAILRRPGLPLRGASLVSLPQPRTSHFILDGRCTATRVSRAATHAELDFVFLRPGQARLWVGRQITRITICGRPPFAHAAPRFGDRQRHGTRTTPRLLKSQREGAQLTPVKSESSPIQNSPRTKA
ncbi:hypothetical protein EDB80DRAFT_363860 [Ilyonectria destructans]|nr:hypothetical protein EDB80DRAFT_363860 [Ilyonectria destructans]